MKDGVFVHIMIIINYVSFHITARTQNERLIKSRYQHINCNKYHVLKLDHVWFKVQIKKIYVTSRTNSKFVHHIKIYIRSWEFCLQYISSQISLCNLDNFPLWFLTLDGDVEIEVFPPRKVLFLTK